MSIRPAGPHFADRLAELVSARSSQVVLGLDPDPMKLWPVATCGAVGETPAQRAGDAVRRHCLAVIEAVGEVVVAVKPQLACFERLGAHGWIALAAVDARGAGRRPPRPGRRQAR